MDKRSIIFIVCVSAAFFVANLYFTQQRQEQEKEWRDYQKLKAEKIEKEKFSDLDKRTKQPENLPLVELYGDEGESDYLTSGVIDQGVILTIGWDQSLPTTVYVRPYKSADNLIPYIMNRDEKNGEISLKGQPVVYSKDGQQTLKIIDLPLFGSHDLQLVTLYSKDAKSPLDVGLGEVTDGKFESFRTQVDMNSPSAVALYEFNGQFYPVGLVSGAHETLVDIEEFDSVHQSLEKIKTDNSVLLNSQGAQEKYYVLENGYQQLVFSNIGGSLVEINLPFAEGKESVSVVKPIQADRDLLRFAPRNVQFPLEKAFLSQKDNLIESQEGGYFPLIRRNFFTPGSLKERKVEPQYYSLNIISEYPELAQLVYTVKEFTSEKIVFEAQQRQRKITKTYTLAKTEESAPYVFHLDLKIEGDQRGLWITTGLLEAEWVAGATAPTMKYRMMKKGEGVVESIDLPADSTINTSITPTWICNSNGFFGIILDPQTEIGAGFRTQKIPGNTVFSRLVALENERPEWNPQDLPSYMMMLPLAGKSASFRVFAGPFANSVLKEIDQIFPNSDYISSQTFHGWFSFISEPFAKFLFVIMNFFHSMTGSWALSIVLLTIVLRVLLYPLNAWSTKSMIAMQRISPKMQAIQEKYKNDKQKAQMEIMELYRKEKVNPFSGCLPLLIQMPFLIGMFDLLKSTFALRGASFIPGWIDDLSAPDVLFSWKYSIPFLGSEFHLLPILLGLVMFFQSKMNSPNIDPSKMTDQQRQQKASGTIMAVLFTVLFYKFPSGLNIYWLSSMLLGILQQWWTQKKMKSQIVKS